MANYFRGYRIKEINNTWIFRDTGKSVKRTWKNRPCGYCGRQNTPEGHDGCLGTLPDVMNACCGHGQLDEAYIQFEDGNRIEGNEAIKFISQIRS